MKDFIIRVGAKIKLNFTPVSALFLRGTQATVNVNVPYTNGNNQTIANGEVLYSSGTNNQEGYFRIISTTDHTFSPSGGDLPISITAYPSAGQANNVVTYTFDGSDGIVNVSYNSRPIIEDIIIDTPNRTSVVITTTIFENAYNDVDGDAIGFVKIHGNTTGIEVDGDPYVSGESIPYDLVQNNKLVYYPDDVDAPYDKNLQYEALDINGNSSL